MANDSLVEKVSPKLDFEQRQRAALIAESREIDLDTASELVYLRNQSAGVDALVSVSLLAAASLEVVALDAKDSGNARVGELYFKQATDIRAALAQLDQLKGEG